jgi:1,4-alpha-glucan branching enzyme
VSAARGGRTPSETASPGRPAELAIVLHTHMPYVEGFGSWPFGEEWLWEAIAGCYLPLLALLDRGAPLTLSVTPVLCDQLAADGLADRFRAFLTGVRRETHRIDAATMRAAGEPALAGELDRAAGDYESALAAFDAIGGELLGRLAAHVTWTSSATHAILPLCATDAGVRLQVAGGVAAHRARFGAWGGGFWLPECAYAPWLDPLLAAAGVGATCVDMTDHFGLASPEHLRPRRTPDGPVLVPIDRATIELVWHADGYPADGGYRDHHHLTACHHRPWANDGTPYDRDRAIELARAHATDFVARTRERLAPAGGLAVAAMDTEFLGHWWYEGVDWLEAVIDEARVQGLRLVSLDEALARHEPVDLARPGDGPLADAADALGVSSWGAGRDLSTWDCPAVADLAFAARNAELRVVHRGRAAGRLAVRELLGVQASDWAFLTTRSMAGPYPRERVAAHTERVRRVLAGEAVDPAQTRNLAIHAGLSALLEP